MLIQRSIMKTYLDRCDGKTASGGCVYAVGYFPVHIYCRKSIDVNSRVKFFETSAASLLRSGIKILKYSVITQSADYFESKFGCARYEIITGEQSVPYKKVKDIG